MAALISTVCSALVILAFCQIIVETILPEGGTKRYVVFITGLVAVLIIVSTLTMTGPDVLKTIYARTAEMERIAEQQGVEGAGIAQTNPYQEYIQSLIDSHR